MDRTFKSYAVKTFQISARTKFNPEDLSDIPANDLISIVRDLLAHKDSIRNLRDSGVIYIQATNVRPDFEVNGLSQYESSPSYDLSVQYVDSYNKQVDIIDGIRGNVYSV